MQIVLTHGNILDAREIGTRLERIRRRKFGKNIRAFERASGVSRGSVPAIECGDSYPMLDTFQKWLKACDARFSDFFDEPNPEDPYARQFREHHRNLEFVLKRIPPEQSATIAVLKRECELLELQAESRASPRPKQRAGQDGMDGDAEGTATR